MKQVINDLADYVHAGRESSYIASAIAKWSRKYVFWGATRLLGHLMRDARDEMILSDCEWHSFLRNWVVNDNSLVRLFQTKGYNITINDSLTEHDRFVLVAEIRGKIIEDTRRPTVDFMKKSALVSALLSSCVWPTEVGSMLDLVRLVGQHFQSEGTANWALGTDRFHDLSWACGCYLVELCCISNLDCDSIRNVSQPPLNADIASLMLLESIAVGCSEFTERMARCINKCYVKNVLVDAKTSVILPFALRLADLSMGRRDSHAVCEVIELVTYQKIIEKWNDADPLALSMALLESADYHLMQSLVAEPKGDSFGWHLYAGYLVEAFAVQRMREDLKLAPIDPALALFGGIYTKPYPRQISDYPDVIAILIEQLKASRPELVHGL